MCFSATASFALSGILTGIGAASLARNTSNRHLMYAAIPLVFAAQQAAEGVVWLTVDGSAQTLVQRLAVFAFLGVALVVWPMWLPVSLQLIERDPARRRMLTHLSWLGVAVAASAIVLLSRSQPVAVIAGHSIRYDRSGDVSGALEMMVLVAYVLPTVAPFFVSTTQLARAIGALLFLSIPISALVQRDALTSVWCFFAAALSGLIWIAITRFETMRSTARLQSLAENAAM